MPDPSTAETRNAALNVTVHSATQRDIGGPGHRRAGLVTADVVDQDSTYVVQLQPTATDIAGRWSCTCQRGDCAHIEAVKPVTGHGSAAAT